MRLLFVHRYLGLLGGAEADILRSARRLAENGHSTSLLYLEPTGRHEEAWRRAFAPCWSLGNASAPSAIAETILRRWAPDVVYCHNLPELEVLQKFLDSGVPLVRKLHDHQTYCMRGYKYNYFTRRVCTRRTSFRCVFPCLAFIGRNPNGVWPISWVSYRAKRQEIRANQRCDRLIVGSRYQREELLRNGFEPSRIVVLPPVQVWDEKAPASTFSPQNLVLFVGQLVRGKGVDLLLRALAKVRVPFECDILGDGNDRRRCEQLCARLGLRHRVRFHGFVSGAATEPFYRDASLLAFPSVWPEPFGLVGREAFHHGLPVVAFDAGAVGEWLRDGENGFLVPWGDVDQFAGRIEMLLLNKELARRMGRAGQKEIIELEEAARNDDPLERIFLEVLAEVRSCPNDHLLLQSK